MNIGLELCMRRYIYIYRIMYYSTYVTTPGREELDEGQLILGDEVLEVGRGPDDDVIGGEDGVQGAGEGGGEEFRRHHLVYYNLFLG